MVVAEEDFVAEVELGGAHAGGDAGVVIGVGIGGTAESFLGVAELEIEHAVFEAPGALHSELGVGNVIDELELLQGGGLVLLDKGGSHLVEGGGVLVREDG